MLFDSGREFSFLLTEGAVRTWPGSPALMMAQLDRLAQVATLAHVGLGVVPWAVEAPCFPLHGFTIFDGSTSIVDTLTGDLTLTDPEEIGTHMETFVAFGSVAVYGEALRGLLADIAGDYRSLEPRYTS